MCSGGVCLDRLLVEAAAAVTEQDWSWQWLTSTGMEDGAGDPVGLVASTEVNIRPGNY